MPSRGLDVATVDRTIGVADLHDDGAVGEVGELAGLEGHRRVPAALMGPETRMAPFPLDMERAPLVASGRRRFPVVSVRTALHVGSARALGD